jgi:hypothetical protein
VTYQKQECLFTCPVHSVAKNYRKDSHYHGVPSAVSVCHYAVCAICRYAVYCTGVRCVRMVGMCPVFVTGLQQEVGKHALQDADTTAVPVGLLAEEKPLLREFDHHVGNIR